MKVNYRNTIESTTFDKINCGELFRPTNSQRVFMKIWNHLVDDCWNECESRLYDYYENPQDHDFNDIRNEARACVDMTTGEIVLFHRDLQVIQLSYVLEVED